MKQKAKNTFNEGVVADTSAYKTSPNALTDCVNMRRLSTGHDQFVLQTVEGGEQVATLPAAYEVAGSAAFAKVAYLVLRHKTTGMVEIGSFPSPALSEPGSTGTLDYTYRPLVNFKADGTTIGPFRTSGWNLPEGIPVQVECQASYDGTVNLILFGEDVTPILVNTRFAARSGKYEIIERAGLDTNVYTPDSFGDTLNFIQRTDKLLNMRFDGVLAGGSCEAGNYRIFLRYATSDGNVTDIVAESMTCSVFHGQTLSNVRAGKPGEKTDKRIAFHLSNLDTSFPFLDVLFTRSSGTDSAVVNAFQLQAKVPVRSESMNFFLTGFEQTIPIGTELLSTSFATIESFKAGAQLQNRFFPANTKETRRNYDLLQEFARAVTLGAVQQTIPVPSATSGIASLFNTNVLDTTPAPLGSWQGGYANPMNIYHRTGEWSGEAIPYALSFIFNDSSLSPAIPVVGIDNVNNDRTGYDTDAAFAANLQDAIETFNGYDPATGLNTRGVYRFPNRNAPGISSVLTRQRTLITAGDGMDEVEVQRVPQVEDPSAEYDGYAASGYVPDEMTRVPKLEQAPAEGSPPPDPNEPVPQAWLVDMVLYEMQPGQVDAYGNPAGSSYTVSDPSLCANGITFRFPALDSDLFARIEAETIGCVLLRGERYADVLAQGWLIPSLEALKSDDTWYNHSQSYFEDRTNIKFVPSFRGGIEGVQLGGSLNTNQVGLYPMYFAHRISINNAWRQVLSDDRYAFISSDIYASEKYMGQVLNADTERTMHIVGDCRTSLLAPVAIHPDWGGSQYSVAMANEVVARTLAPVRVRTAFTEAGQGAFNRLGFSSNIKHLEGKRGTNNFVRAFASFNSYVGVHLTDSKLSPASPLRLFECPIDGNFDVTVHSQGAHNKTVDAAYLANIYSGLTQRTTAQVGDVYGNINAIRYRPISQRLYWRDGQGGASVEALLSPANKVTVFGGDCFLSMTLRNMLYNPITKDDTDWLDKQPVNIGSVVQLCHESNMNGMLRESDNSFVAERFVLGQERSFQPILSNVSDALLSDPSKNGFRKHRVPESGLSNLGHSDTSSAKIVVALPQNVPYIATRFDTRVYFSDPHIPGSFVNGYRNIVPTAHRDYARHMGEITRLLAQGDHLYAMFEHGVAYLPVLERVQTARDGAGAIFIAPSEILGERIGIRSAFYGLQWPTAAVATDNHVYGIDLDEAKIWRTKGEDLELLSDDRIESLLLGIIGTYRGNVFKRGVLEVSAFYDRAHAEVYFSFFAAGKPDKSRTFVFNEKHGQWEGRYLFNANQYLSLSKDDVFSVPVAQGSLVRHHVESTLASFYGEAPSYEYEFIVGTDESGEEPVQRIFDNFEIACNGVLPTVVVYTNDKRTISQPMVATGHLFKRNITRREDVVYIQIDPAGETRTRDRYMRVRIQYTSAQRALVHSVVTAFRVSAN